MFWSNKGFWRIGGIAITVTAAVVTANPSSAQTERYLDICRNAVVGLHGVPASSINLSPPEASNDGTSVSFQVANDPTATINGRRGTSTGICNFDSSGRLIKLDTVGIVIQSPSHFRDFGDISGVGRIIVILRESSRGRETAPSGGSLFYSTIGREFYDEESVFPVIVDDRRERWWADCRTNRIGRIDANNAREQPVNQSAITTEISELVCTE